MRTGAIGGALLGAVLGTVPGGLFAFRMEQLNPWFVDDPLGYTLGALVPLAVVGGLLGLVLGRRADRRPGADPRRAWALKTGVPLAILQMYLVASVYSSPTPAKVDARLVIVGIDGAGWELMDSLELPTLQAMQARGVRSELTSREPMFSPLLWTTMATGKVPEEHGIHGFRVQADQARAARFWEIAHERGLRVGLYKWLVTWPPEAFEQDRALAERRALSRSDGEFYLAALDKGRGGFVVPAWLAPSPEVWPADLGFIKELELSRRLKRKAYGGARPSWKLALEGIEHGLRWSTLVEAARWTLTERFSKPREEERAARLQLLRVQMDRDVFIHALHFHRPDVASFTTYATDALGHTHYGFMDDCRTGKGPCNALADALPAAYRQADQVLAEILASVDPQTTVLVVSDHGFRVMGEQDAGRYFAPKTERLKERLEAEVGHVDVSKGGHKITVALLEEDLEAQRARLLAFLQGLTQQSTGQPFYRWEEVPGAARSVGLTMADERVDEARLQSDTVGGEPLSDYAKLTEAYTGEHDAAGILLAQGPDLPAGQRLDPVPLLDLAPTILALLDLPAAVDMPGQAVFGERLARVATWEQLSPAARGLGGTGEADFNEDALKALGYIED